MDSLAWPQEDASESLVTMAFVPSDIALPTFQSFSPQIRVGLRMEGKKGVVGTRISFLWEC